MTSTRLAPPQVATPADSAIVRGCSRLGLMSSTALQAVAAVAVLAMVPRAHAQLPPGARPAGGQVVAGQAGITQSANQTTIVQTSQNAAVNWQSYNVGSGQTVRYVDPSSRSVTLNRVVGPNPSEVAGRITSNGTVIIVNQAGLLFAAGAQIDTAGLVVSAAGISNSNLMAGKLVFDQAAKPGATIENRGTFTIKDQGLAALVAPQVANSGVIRARLGKVILAGAEATTLDLYGDGLVSINVTKQVATAPGGNQVLVTNTGVISASGGSVLLTAQAVDGVVQTLVDAGGKIAADTVGGQTGRVAIAGAGGDVIVSGAIAANGHAAGTTGGSVVVNTTGAVTLAPTARIGASGPAGGGLVAIGTTARRARGGPAVVSAKTATTVVVQSGANIAANATVKGDGGRVTILSTKSTDMAGTISATGGPLGGNGGFAEVSGNLGFALTGMVDLSAPRGGLGTVLLDPKTLDVVQGNAGKSGLNGSFNNGGTISANVADAKPDTVTNSEIQLVGASGNVVLQTSTGTIGVHATIDVANSLILQAGSNLLIDRGVTIGAGSGLFLSSGTATAETGSILIGTTGPMTSGSVLLSAPNVTMQAGVASAGYGIDLTDTAIQNGTGAATVVDLSAKSGGIRQLGTGSINTGTLLSSLGVTGTVALAGANTIGLLGSFQVGSGDFTLANNIGSLNVTGPLHATGSVAVNAGSIVLATAANVQGSTIALTGSNGIALNGSASLGEIGALVDLTVPVAGGVTQLRTGTIVAATLQSSGGIAGPVSLPGSANAIGALGSLAVAGGFSLTNAGSLNVTGPLHATGSVAVNAGSIVLANAANVQGSTIALTGSNGIALNGSASLGEIGALVDLTVPAAGGVTQAGTGTIVAATLQSSGGIAGAVSLPGSANAIGALGSLGVAGGIGDFFLMDSKALTVVGTVTAPGNVFIQSSNVAGITVGATGSIGAGSNASFETDAFSIVAGGTITGSIFELAPNTQGGILTLGTSGAGLSLVSLAGIGPASLNLGAVTLPGSTNVTTTAGSISIAGTFGASADGINLFAIGAISQSAPLTANILSGSGASVTLMNPGNTITEAYNLAATGGNLAVASGPNLVSFGTIYAKENVFLQSSGGISIGGTVNSGGLASFQSNNFAVAFSESSGTVFAQTFEWAPYTSGTAIGVGFVIGTTSGSYLASLFHINASNVRIGAVTLPGSIGPTTFAGSIAVQGIFGSAAINLELDSLNGIVQSAGAILTAKTLSGHAINDVILTQANTIAAVGDFIVSSGSFGLNDSGLVGNLIVAGSVGATGVSIGGAPTLTVSGTIGSGPTMTLTAGGGGIVLNAGDVLSGGTIGLNTSGGGVTQDPAGTIAAGTLLTNSGLAGTVNLAGTANAIAAIGSVTVTGGDFRLLDTGSLTASGPLSAANIGLTAGTIGVAGAINAGTVLALSATGGNIDQTGGSIGAVTLTGGAATSATMTQTGNLIGTLAAFSTAAGFALTDNESLTVAGPVKDIGATSTLSLTTKAGDLILAGTVSAANVLDIVSAGTIGQSGGTIGAGTLNGSALASASFVSGNSIVSLGTFNAPNGFTLTDATGLSITGPVTSNSGSVVVNTGTFGLGVPGTIVASSATLSAGSIVLGGSLHVAGAAALFAGGGNAGTVDISTLAGGLTQGSSGTLIAGILTSGSGIAGAATLAGTTNQIGTIAALSATGGLTVVDNQGLTLAGLVNAGTNGIADITVASGGLTQSGLGTLIAQALLSSGDIVGSISLLGGVNQIANLGSASNGAPGSLRATGGIDIVDTSNLTIAGDVVAGSGTPASSSASLTILIPTNKLLTVNGEAIAASPAGSVQLTAGSITLARSGSVPPLVEANGAVTLSATNTVSQSAGAIAGGSVAIAAPGGAALSGGTIVTSGNGGSVAIVAPLTTVGANEIIAGLGPTSAISFSANVTQSAASYIGANGSVTVGSLLTESGGIMLAARDIVLGALSESAGTVAAGNVLSIGQGIGVPGWAGSAATAGTFDQTGGELAASGSANIFTAGAFVQTRGLLATGGTLGVTANNGISIAGDVSAAGAPSGFMLLAAGGNAVVANSGLLGGAALATAGDAIPGNVLQAPSGAVLIAGPSGTQGFGLAGAVGAIAPVAGYAIAPPAGPPPPIELSPPSAGQPGVIPISVRLAGGAIDIERPIVAATLGLDSGTTIVEGPTGLIAAGRLTGSAGGNIALNQANVIGTLGALSDPGHAIALVDASNLMLAGQITATSVTIKDVGYTIDLVQGNGYSGLGSGTTNSLNVGAFPVPGSPGVYLLASDFAVLTNPVIATSNIVDWTFALPPTGSGNVGLGVFLQPHVKLFLSLGAGTASGQVDVAGLQVAYSIATKVPVNLTGSVGGIAGQTAASTSHISPEPSNNYQINGCPISAFDCIKFTGLTVPVFNPLNEVDVGEMLPLSDLDIVLPDVAEKDY